MREETIKFPKINKVTRQDKVTLIYGIHLRNIILQFSKDGIESFCETTSNRKQLYVQRSFTGVHVHVCTYSRFFCQINGLNSKHLSPKITYFEMILTFTWPLLTTNITLPLNVCQQESIFCRKLNDINWSRVAEWVIYKV